MIYSYVMFNYIYLIYISSFLPMDVTKDNCYLTVYEPKKNVVLIITYNFIVI